MKFLLINPTARYWRVGTRPVLGAPPCSDSRCFRAFYVAAAMPPGVETTIVDEEVEPIDLRRTPISLAFPS